MLVCPICRGTARIVAHFLYVVYEREDGTSTVPENAQHASIATPPTPPVSAFATPHQSPQRPSEMPQGTESPVRDTPRPSGLTPNQIAFPWWPNSRDEQVFNTVTLPEGMSIIVDPGAYTNLAGKLWVRQQCIKAKEHNLLPKHEKMREPIGVAGVGEGSQKCVWQAQVPIAVSGEYPSGSEMQIHTFECPIVEGTGESVPALLGLKSMSSKNAILEMTPGKEALIFPGPGGYEIKLEPGYTRIPLKSAPSGHLCIPTDHFDRVPRAVGGLPQASMQLLARVRE